MPSKQLWYIYDPDKGNDKINVPAGTAFHDIPDDWQCPHCGSSKKTFRPLAGPGSVIEDGI
jgi:rubredoxin